MLISVFGGNLPTHAKDVNNFYFDSFDADYYITRDSEGVSHMRVVETLTAVFPDYEQNLGIVRYIPSTNQAGANITAPSAQSLNLSVTRNGLPEPIYSLEKEDGYYAVSTGDDTTYLLGEQVFVFEYEFEKVITDFNNYQELYWDTNGTGWAQRFNSVTARVHFDSRLASALDTDAATPSCYVGAYGSNNTDRCTITRTASGYQFTADTLAAGENLTFAIPLAPHTFVVPVTINSAFILCVVVTGAVFILATIFLIKYARATRTQRDFYKNLFVKPEYQPMPDLDVAEAAKISLINTTDSRVATLIELAVAHKITLIKEDKSQWKIRVNDLSDASSDQRIVLTILNGGEIPAEGFEFVVEKHSPTVALQSLGIRYTSGVTSSLERKSLLLSRQPKDVAKLTDILTIISVLWAFAVFGLFVLLTDSYGIIPGAPFSLIILAVVAFAIFIVPFIVTTSWSRYTQRTEAGLRAARYFEGLRLYMKMAEADRLKFLQSVDGADTTNTGIVKLYEKLLPYAIIFGLESSWMQELRHYYDMDDVSAPDWYTGTAMFSTHDFHQFVTSSSSSIHSSTFSSSSSSGSSGGGFSGGGGGGGGGGGR